MRYSFISVDWGTSSLRAYRVVDNEIRDRLSTADGILSVAPGQYAPALAAQLNAWPIDGPIVLSGMIGSRQGWKEAPYVPCPADPQSIASARLAWQEAGLGDLVLLPGLLTHDARGVPDVMRGEEAQVIGAMHALGVTDGVFLLPGTHSKSVRVRAGRIETFVTFMTGEIFAALKAHTILGRLMTDGPTGGLGFERGIAHGAEAGPTGALLHRAFATRTLGLFDLLPTAELSDYLSGLLIGAELAACLSNKSPEAVVVGANDLSRRYIEGARLLGFSLTLAPEDCVALGQRVIMSHVR
jgi:2-dehydro-3-deoxygalactonokinase